MFEERWLRAVDELGKLIQVVEYLWKYIHIYIYIYIYETVSAKC